MELLVLPFLKSALVWALAFMVLAFTPFAILPIGFSMATLGWSGVLTLLIVAGAPFGGFLFLWIFTKRDQFLSAAASLAGFWVGSVGGSVAGLSVKGEFPWT